jgi:hypothetical protein
MFPSSALSTPSISASPRPPVSPVLPFLIYLCPSVFLCGHKEAVRVRLLGLPRSCLICVYLRSSVAK